MTDVFQEFQGASDPSSDWEYLQFTDMKTRQGPSGTYYRLTCLKDDGGPEIHATCDGRYREHLRPYLDLLLKSRNGLCTERPVVPLFEGDDGKWRLSTRAAEQDYPEVRNAKHVETQEAPVPEGSATRLQVSVSRDIAVRFKRIAAEHGMAHTDYLLQLINATLT